VIRRSNPGSSFFLFEMSKEDSQGAILVWKLAREDLFKVVGQSSFLMGASSRQGTEANCFQLLVLTKMIASFPLQLELWKWKIQNHGPGFSTH
jgi:hypothetical protein